LEGGTERYVVLAKCKQSRLPLPPKIKLVVAGSFYQFIDWILENELHPTNPANAMTGKQSVPTTRRKRWIVGSVGPWT
jgi:hypothetical protein